MKKFFEFFAKRHMLATLLTLIILMLGLGSLLTIKRDIFPNVDFGVMEIATFYPGASPEDVELNVTNKIEDQLKNVVGIDKIISVSLENLSHIQVILDPDIKDIEKVKWDIRDSVGRVTDFPDAVTETPLITEIDTSLMQIIDIGITGDIPYNELRDIAKYFEDKLLELSGISRITKVGYRAREIKVEVGPRYMDEYQIPLREIIRVIQSRNIRSTGGTFE